jgi:4,5-dihydroxyphthalate decarboxylase
MTHAHLTTVTRTQGNNAALKNGSITPRDARLDFVEVPVLVHAFRRMVRTLEFDVCEMAMTTYLCAKARGTRFTALPIFLVRGFHHGAILVNTKAGISHPKDLEGRRVGVNRGYTVTTGVWARGLLEEEHGVDLDRVTWVLSGDEHVVEYRPPANVVPMEPGQDLGRMVASGELAAVVGVDVIHPDVAPLFPDPEAAGFDALRHRGLYPINHLVAVKDEVLEARPGLATDLFEAFAAAKNRYVELLREGLIESPTPIDVMHKQVMEILGDDPLPYGIAANRANIEHLVTHAVSQKVLDRPLTVEEIFPQETHDLVG